MMMIMMKKFSGGKEGGKARARKYEWNCCGGGEDNMGGRIVGVPGVGKGAMRSLEKSERGVWKQLCCS